MDATINDARTVGAIRPAAVGETEVSHATQIARYSMLEELPGLMFGVVTVAYIVLSLASLAL